MANRPKPFILVMLDGFGLRSKQDNNAIALAFTPCGDGLKQEITNLDFDKFERGCEPLQGCFATLTEYHQDFDYPVAYPSVDVKNSIGEVLSNLGMKQLHLAETGKYAHATFFLNGGRDAPFEGEDRILVPSQKVETYDMQPEMSAPEVTDHLVDAITAGQYDVIICNYANCDMVGHTGKLKAVIKVVETIDACLEKIVAALIQISAWLPLTADHGNIEQMIDEISGQAHAARSMNLAPLGHVGGNKPLLSGVSLAGLAPTMLAMLGVQQPAQMTGHSLIGQ